VVLILTTRRNDRISREERDPVPLERTGFDVAAFLVLGLLCQGTGSGDERRHGQEDGQSRIDCAESPGQSAMGTHAYSS
jgi:hypothetical protein